MLKKYLIDYVKNIRGWKTSRKIVVFSVDDYGNVRLASRKAREKMNNAGLKILSRFDAFDALETREDLEMLYEVLTSVKDIHGRPVVFTPFALPCNLDFEKMAEDNNEHFYYEQLPETYKKLTAIDPISYQGTWELWNEGIKNGLMKPQFHGREHLNLKILEEKLGARDHEVITALNNRSYTSISNSGYPTISVTAAFEFWDFRENEQFRQIIIEGLDHFKKVFGYESDHFNAPGGSANPVIHPWLVDAGIRNIDEPWIKKEHLGKGKFKWVIHYTGLKNHAGLNCQVRNIVFEPCDGSNRDWVAYAFKQIQTAFYLNRPAIISSHRINFCGHINEQNRKTGIQTLKKLIDKIVKYWPDVEFLSSSELGILTQEYQ